MFLFLSYSCISTIIVGYVKVYKSFETFFDEIEYPNLSQSFDKLIFLLETDFLKISFDKEVFKTA